LPRRDNASDRIQRLAEQRQIPFLLHFSLARNLPNVIEHGILPREELHAAGFIAYAATQYRLDGDDGAVSTSISAISRRIFEAKRKNTGTGDWVVLFLDRNVLWTHNCRFCFRNAATGEMQSHRGYLGGPWAFTQMFSDEMAPPNFKGGAYRADTGIPSFLTTDPDAEVQVFGGIRPETIVGAWVSRRDLAEVVQDTLNQLPGQERDVVVDEFAPFSNGFSEWVVPRSMF